MAPNLELILARSLAANLAVPSFLAEPSGKIVYFNEAAELLLGRGYEDTPELSSQDLVDILRPVGEEGAPMTAEQMPIPRAIATALPAHTHASSYGDEPKRYLATAIPFLDRDGLVLGALLFWYGVKA
jgi:PAS fold